ncbi:hypothetical protein [Subtercola boreus]|uniref:Uncharacterized protein n=1 Tax=Subtercola boreus TaxID=120213 RepID=A0A3E0W827_9MICO|nr:hypothetical protein [Subtercola boreus]RFA18054.1 hypothetical protein B7R24_15490 [Subtercola boreus]RFA18436.1 hypothetical protein B7R23_15525 [Subtercola boreus]RFA24965.1 hypothetical protein B7R25_15520 [Subtercola boreus]
MKRINLFYGGQPYSVGNRDLDELLAEIAAGLGSDETRWLSVNVGEGRPRQALLALTRGIDIAVIPVPALDEEPDEVSNESPPPPAR